MLWRWFQDWCDRRAALRDLKDSQRADEAVLMDQNQNPLNLAKLSVVSDPVEAAAQWERARRLMPNAVVESEDSLEILLGLKRYDEADALMRERQSRLRGDRFSVTGLARIAEQRGDFPEALKRWEVVRSRVRDSIDGYDGCARCLLHLGRLEEAETQLQHALRRDPFSHDARVGLARISDRRKDWGRSLIRWKELAETRHDSHAFAFVAKALIELGRLDEAEAALAEPARLYTNNLDIAITRAELAQHRGDLTGACDRWATVRAIDPYLPAGYHEGVHRLLEAGRRSDAEAVLRVAIERFPDQAWPLQSLARIAHDQRDWTEAAARWAALRQRFPADETGYSMGAAALRAAGRDDEAVELRCPP